MRLLLEGDYMAIVKDGGNKCDHIISVQHGFDVNVGFIEVDSFNSLITLKYCFKDTDNSWQVNSTIRSRGLYLSFEQALQSELDLSKVFHALADYLLATHPYLSK